MYNYHVGSYQVWTAELILAPYQQKENRAITINTLRILMVRKVADKRPLLFVY